MQARETRYNTELPTQLDGIEGIARNISASGMYIEMEGAPTPGQTVSLVLDMMVMGQAVQWVCNAVVVRQDSVDGKPGFGAKILSQHMLESPPA